MELVSWQIGRAAGRLRARIGPHVDVPAFAALVVPAVRGTAADPAVGRARASSTSAGRARALDRPRPRPSAAPACVVLTGALDRPRRRASTASSTISRPAGVPVGHAPCSPGTVPAAARRRRGRRARGRRADARARRAHRRAGGAGLADRARPRARRPRSRSRARVRASPSRRRRWPRRVASSLRRPGACHTAARGDRRPHARAADAAHARARGAASLRRRARAPVDPTAARVIGWRLGDRAQPRRTPTPSPTASRSSSRVPAPTVRGRRRRRAGCRRRCAGHERVRSCRCADLDAETIAGWAVHVWTPLLVAGEIARRRAAARGSELRAACRACCPAAACSGVDGFVSPYVLVEAAEHPDAVGRRAAPRARRPAVRTGAQRRSEARRRADAVDGPAAAKAVVNRFLGWADVPRRAARTGDARERRCSPSPSSCPSTAGSTYTRALPRERRAARRDGERPVRAPRDRRRVAGAARCASYVDEFASTAGAVPDHGAAQRREPRLRRDRQPRPARRAPGDVVILNADTAVTDGLARPPRGRRRAPRRRDGHAADESRIDLHAARHR